MLRKIHGSWFVFTGAIFLYRIWSYLLIIWMFPFFQTISLAIWIGALLICSLLLIGTHPNQLLRRFTNLFLFSTLLTFLNLIISSYLPVAFVLCDILALILTLLLDLILAFILVLSQLPLVVLIDYSCPVLSVPVVISTPVCGLTSAGSWLRC